MHRVTTLEQVVDQLLSLFYRPAARDSRVASSGGDVVERGDSGGCDDGGGGGSRIRGSFDALATRQLYEQWAGEAAARGRDDVRLSPKPGKD